MKFTKLHLDILHILWSSDTPMSVQGIAEKSKYRIAGRLIISIAIDNLLAKDAVYQAGAFHDYSGEIEKVLILYAAKIRFDEYYVEQFKNIKQANKKGVYLDYLKNVTFQQYERTLTFIKNRSKQYIACSDLVDRRGIEPLTSRLRTWRSPS